MRSSQQLESAHRDEAYNSAFELGLIRTSAQLLLSQLHGDRVLELGCGLGIITEALASTVRYLTVAEVSSYFIEETRKKVVGHAAEITWLQQSWESLDEDVAYTDVVCFRALDCVEDIAPLLQKLHAWAAKGAVIHVVITNTRSFHRIVGERLGIDRVQEQTARSQQVGRLQHLHEERMHDYFRQYHFHVLYQQGIGFKMFDNAKMDTFDSHVREAFLQMGDVSGIHAVELYYKLSCA